MTLRLGPALVSVHAHEGGSVNAIPAALAELLSERLGIEYNDTVVQTNLVCHTGADGYGRLARQARFEGAAERGRMYLMVDDFIGQGGTLANLRGWIETQGGRVGGAVALTGKPYSAILAPSKEQLHELRQKHGKTSRSGGESISVTPSTALLNQKLGTSPVPRMLTPSEIDLLRRSAREIAEGVRKELANKGSASRN